MKELYYDTLRRIKYWIIRQEEIDNLFKIRIEEGFKPALGAIMSDKMGNKIEFVGNSYFRYIFINIEAKA